MMNLKRCLRVYLIMGSNNTVRDPLSVLEEALKGGITLFQYREKGANAKVGQEKKELAMKMKRLCHKYSVPFIVNDDVLLALEIGADGVHVGQDDEIVASIKAQCPKDFIIGVSTTNSQEANQAVKDGADYIGVGPIYATDTKEDVKLPIGLEGVAEIRSTVGDLPIVAIGGIKTSHVAGIIQAGADGVSVISAISQAKSPKIAARQLASLINPS
ncbi:thiamine phosphate synthase [Aquibacillus halophilus]|uniref:Thiamine-phosphate synthase n=1 Tax=Aquibacillus halophilus TaxID=930132 RepID=A0A6A8DIZ3_9BACI|nr:thiamine phosphate synthase [Aquibacillus halophilus]MRH43721.1 thiamine phosphate synthase [Aquibacillus halophilus]